MNAHCHHLFKGWTCYELWPSFCWKFVLSCYSSQLCGRWWPLHVAVALPLRHPGLCIAIVFFKWRQPGFFFFLFPLQLSGHTASCFGSVTTLLFCQIAHPYHFGFSFGVCTFPPAASTYSCHVSSFITTWFWGYDDPEGHFVQLQLILQMSWALWEKDRGLRQAVLLSSGAVSEILPGSFTWSQGSYGTSQSVSFYSGWALSPSQVD